MDSLSLEPFEFRGCWNTWGFQKKENSNYFCKPKVSVFAWWEELQLQQVQTC